MENVSYPNITIWKSFIKQIKKPGYVLCPGINKNEHPLNRSEDSHQGQHQESTLTVWELTDSLMDHWEELPKQSLSQSPV